MTPLRYTLPLLGLCLAALLPAGCGPHDQHDDARDALRVTVAAPLVQEVPNYQYYTGNTKAVNSVDIRARVSGYLDKVFIKEGQLVEEGQKLFEIDRRPYQALFDKADAELTRTRASDNTARLTLAREEKLMATKGATSKKDYDDAVGRKGEAAAAVGAAEASLREAKLNLDFTIVLSPIKGRMRLYATTQGNLVEKDKTVLTTIVSYDPMYAYFPIDENSMLYVKKLISEGKFKGTTDGGVVPVEMQLADQHNYPYKGVLNFVDPELDPKTGTLQLRGRFDNKNGALQPGLFCKVRCSLGEPAKKFLVSDRALVSQQGKKYLYIVDKSNLVQSLPVVVGTLVNGLRVIEEGVTGDERVIVNGLQMVRPGLTVDPVPGKMEREPGQ